MSVTASNARNGLVDIGGVQRPYVREATAAYLGPGSVDPAFLFFNPIQNLEVNHV